MEIENMKTENMDVRSFALAYALKGWAVLPLHSYIDGGCTCGKATCISPAKHPITCNGVKDATTNPDIITRWIDETDGLANLGIATGNGLLVLDVDAKSGGPTTLASLEERLGGLPLTPTVQTGGGGRHFYFRYPEGLSLGNKNSLVPGIDIRGEGGYVVGPPSQHASGQRYRWETPADAPIADAPTWLLRGIADRESLAVTTPTAGTSGTVLRVQASPTDLSGAPGVPEGQRHARLCQLVGIHLARGETADVVEIAALAWGARCDPPMDGAEVNRTVRSLAAKHAAQGHRSPTISTQDEVDEAVLPEPQPRPELHPDALAGLAGEIVRTVSPHTEADPIGILLTLMACVGNAVGKVPYCGVGADTHHANLFIGLVGDTASGKGQAWSIARSLMQSADPEWEAQCIGYGLSSGEGLVERVMDDAPDEDDGGVILSLPPVKRLLCYESEFARPITAMRREGNTLSALLRAAWDGQTLEVMTRGRSKLKASNAHIGIVSHITPDELSNLLSGSVEIANGFANRFLWCHVERARLLPHGGDPGVLDAFAKPLADALTRAKAIGRVRRNPDADRLWEGVYASLAEARPGAFGRATERARPQVIRLALIYSLLDGSPAITSEHLRSALAVWRYCEASARMIFSPVDAEGVDPLEQQLLGIIRRSPGVNRKGLHKSLGGHIPASNLVNALAKLRDRRLIRAERVSTGGRPSECWWPVQTPTMPPCNGFAVTAPAGGDANERTKPQEPAAPVSPDRQTEEDGSLVRTPMTLVDLFAWVRGSGGKIVRSEGGGFAIQGVAGSLPPAVPAALEAHRSELDLIVPSPVPPPIGEVAGQDQVASNAPASDDAQAPAADSLFRCGKCGVAVVGSSDEICDACFLADLDSVRRGDAE
jgi:hypothetical protein